MGDSIKACEDRESESENEGRREYEQARETARRVGAAAREAAYQAAKRESEEERLGELQAQVEDLSPLKLPPNPKAKFGAQKPDLSLIPGSAQVAEALAMEDGARKYGAFNWRISYVEAMTYVAAFKRHVDAWVDGDALTTDTNVPNLGAARACLGILIDAEASGTLIDNRPKATGASARLQDEVKAGRAAKNK